MQKEDAGDPAGLVVREIVGLMRVWLERAEACMDQLADTHMWYRPNQASNAIGNLVLHLVGNLRQWVLSGVGGQPDTRDRPAEFSATSGLTKRELMTLLHEVVEQSCDVIDHMPSERLLEKKTIQGNEVTLAYALVMAASHLGLHVGQIQYIGKVLLSDSYKPGWKPDASERKPG